MRDPFCYLPYRTLIYGTSWLKPSCVKLCLSLWLVNMDQLGMLRYLFNIPIICYTNRSGIRALILISEYSINTNNMCGGVYRLYLYHHDRWRRWIHYQQPYSLILSCPWLLVSYQWWQPRSWRRSHLHRYNPSDNLHTHPHPIIGGHHHIWYDNIN